MTSGTRAATPGAAVLLAAVVVAATLGGEPAPPPGGSKPAAAASPRYRFRDVSEELGVAQTVRTWGSAWTDFDGDDRPDLLLGRHWRVPTLYVNAGPRFRRLRTPPDLRGTDVDRHQCAWGEANRDGLPDLLCTQGADRGKGEGPNQLLLNTGDGFRDRARAFGVRYSKSRGRTVNWVDYDGDGDLDVFLGTTERRGFPMELFKRGRDRFRRARVGLSHELSVASSAWADWDRDGDFDLVVTQHYPAPAYAFENVRGRSFRQVDLPRITDTNWLSASWGDFDGDGWVDLQTTGRKRLRIWRNRRGRLRPVFTARLNQGRAGTWLDVDNDGDLDSFVVQGARGNSPNRGSVNWRDFLVIRTRGGFERVDGPSFRGPLSGNGEVATVADFDRDGRVDVFVTNGLHHWRGPTGLLHNRTAGGSWAGVDLRGPRKNPFGYGAIVEWRLGRRVLRRQMTDEVAFKGQSEVGYVHLGLGGRRSARVKVRWPGGAVDCKTVAAGTILVVEKGALGCP